MLLDGQAEMDTNKPMNGPLPAADFDLVGKYDQNRINGFSGTQICELIEYGNLVAAQSVLDLMAGDGNLSEAIVDYCLQRDCDVPHLTLLDLSAVQCSRARARKSLGSASIIQGDICDPLASGLTNGMFDRVFLKSAAHEIPFDTQPTLYANIFRLLSEGGLFINLGFLFDSQAERDEFREIARVKDRLARHGSESAFSASQRIL